MKTDAKKIIVKVVAWIFAVIACMVVVAIAGFSLACKPASTEEKAVSKSIKIGNGTSVTSAARTLKTEGLIRSEKAFYLAARYNLFNRKNPFCLKSGVYTIKSSMSLKEITELLQSGRQEYISVSIPEGLTMSKIGSILEDASVCSRIQFLEACRNADLLNEYNIQAESFEGYLFPDTYFFTPFMAPESVIRILADNFFKRITEVPGLAEKTPAQLHKTLILASIVEREYRVKEEAPVIASVFSNRLKYNIGLYSCATVEYIITEINGLPHPDRITYEDLKSENPYNTYKYAGLTPGPISNPGLIALNAACNPAKTNYYYFVLTDPATGSHTFSTSFDEHIAAENLNYRSKSR